MVRAGEPILWLMVSQPAKNPGETGKLGSKVGVPGRFGAVSNRISASTFCW